MKLLLKGCRLLVGLLFVFSGLVKANDPLALSYKMQEFFSVLHLGFLSGTTLALSLFMIVLEILLGVTLLLGFRQRFFAWLLLLLSVFFTFLTAYAYLSGKIADCGCFGSCIPLSSEASFWKDVVLLLLVLLLFARRKDLKPVMAEPLAMGMVLATVAIALGLQIYVLRHLPFRDCLAFHVGVNIPDAMQLPKGAMPDQYRTVFVYEKNGRKQEFAEDAIPWQDTSWHYVRRMDKLVRKGTGEPPIKDFDITDLQGNDSTQAILEHPGYVFLFFVQQVSEASGGWEARMATLQQDCARQGIALYGITASPAATVIAFRRTHHLDFPFLELDATVIKTAARTNPCLMLLHQGTIQGKWSYLDMPAHATAGISRGLKLGF